MAYTNGIFYIDYINGNDNARTALTSVSFAWNAGTSKMRATKTSHGLVTGAIVDVTGTTNLNEAWTITVIDANTFDLDASTNQSNQSGTVTPRGGSSWTDAWKTINTGATSARHQAGDEIRIAQTPELSAGVNATFTNSSRNVTLASAVTKTIQNATTNTEWTMTSGIGGGTSTTRKFGSTAFTITTNNTTGKIAYATIAGGGTQDFSGFTKLSFWLRETSGLSITQNCLTISLCSDTLGNTPVNSFNFPSAAISATSNFTSVVLDNVTGLGNNIQSVAIYANTGIGSKVYSINNIQACNNITHESLIGLAGDCIYAVKNINGTTIELDSASNAGGGSTWSGTTSTGDLKYIQPISFNSGTSTSIAPTRTGSPPRLISYIGGWNTSSNTVTGRTAFSNLTAGAGFGLSTSNTYINYKNFIFARYQLAISQTLRFPSAIENVVITSCSSGFTVSSCTMLNCIFTMISSSSPSSAVRFINCNFLNYAGSLPIETISSYFNCTFRNNANAIGSSGERSSSRAINTLVYNCLFEDANEFSLSDIANISVLWSYNHDQVTDNHWGFTFRGTVNWQTSVKQGSDPGAWRVVFSNAADSRTEQVPIRFQIAQIAVEANKQVTVKAWVKKDNATTVGCKIMVEGSTFTLPGITETSATAANNTNWQELTITFTPTQEGVVPIWFESFYISGNSNTYVGSITVTQ